MTRRVPSGQRMLQRRLRAHGKSPVPGARGGSKLFCHFHGTLLRDVVGQRALRVSHAGHTPRLRALGVLAVQRQPRAHQQHIPGLSRRVKQLLRGETVTTRRRVRNGPDVQILRARGQRRELELPPLKRLTALVEHPGANALVPSAIQRRAPTRLGLTDASSFILGGAVALACAARDGRAFAPPSIHAIRDRKLLDSARRSHSSRFVTAQLRLYYSRCYIDYVPFQLSVFRDAV